VSDPDRAGARPRDDRLQDGSWFFFSGAGFQPAVRAQPEVKNHSALRADDGLEARPTENRRVNQYLRMASSADGYPCGVIRSRLCFVLAVVLPLAGCTSPTLLDAQQAFRQGNLPAAQSRINRFVESQSPRGSTLVLALLEQGSVRHALGDYAGSNESFAAAQRGFAFYDARPEVSLSRETLAAISNLNALPYRGPDHERIMAATYRALNYLLLGEPGPARVELRKAYERQRVAVEANAQRIEQANAAAQLRPSGEASYDADRARQDPLLQRSLQTTYADLDRFAAYGDYVNPFTEWLTAVYHRGEAVDGNDLEWSRKSFERVAGMVPDNPYVQADYEAAEAIAAGGAIAPTTYVVFATGTAPRVGEVRLDIPLWIFSRQVDYFGANFPRLIFNPAFVASLSVRAEGKTYRSRLLCDMDAVIARQFQNELPVIVTKTLISAGAKAAAVYGLRRSVQRQDHDLAVLLRLFGLLYQYGSNQADLRTWASLPKQFQLLQCPTPRTGPNGRRTIEITVPGQAPVEVRLRDARLNLVLVRSITPAGPLRIDSFTLGPAPVPGS
jgi:hypothetical protein